MFQRTCETCGAAYSARMASSRFCGDTCRKRASRKRLKVETSREHAPRECVEVEPSPSALILGRMCEHCGEPIAPEARRGQKYCGSAPCVRSRDRERYRRNAEASRERSRRYYHDMTDSQRSERHEQRRLNYRRQAAAILPWSREVEADCMICQGTFAYVRKTCPRTVCDDCRSDYQWTPRRMANATRRRAWKETGTLGERDLIWRTLYDDGERDCHICGDPVDPTHWRIVTGRDGIARRVTLGLHPSIDHIVPLKLGGLHVRSNVKIAHCSCNSRKGAKLQAA